MAARKKKTTTRKKTTRKKVVKETSYKVTKTSSDAGAGGADEDTVQADSAADAAEKVTKSDPRRGRYDKVTIEKDKGGAGAPNTEPRTEPDTASKVKPRGFESVDFPYNIALPMGFKVLFESLPNKTTEGLTFGTRYGKLHITVPDAETLSGLISEVEKKARGRTEVKSMAGLVANGINESVKK